MCLGEEAKYGRPRQNTGKILAENEKCDLGYCILAESKVF